MNLNELPDMTEALKQVIEGQKKKDSKKRWQDDDGDGKWYEKSDVDGKISDREKKEKKKNEEVEHVDEKISASGYARAKKWREDQAREKDKKEQEYYANKAKTHKWDGEKWNKKESVEYDIESSIDEVEKQLRDSGLFSEEELARLDEISADKLLDASKAADKDRGKKAVAGDKAGAAKRVKQASKFYAAAASKRKQEAKEEYTVTNADKKGNTPAWQGYKSGKKNAKTGKPLYKAADHVKEAAPLKSFREFVAEGNPTTRMLTKSKTQTTGNISADRGTDAKKNRESRKGLEKDLKKKGIGYKKGVGEYKYDSGEKGREVSYQTSPGKGMSKRRFGKVMRRLGRKHGQESVITKDKGKSAKLHTTEKGTKKKSESLGKSQAGKHPKGYGETSGTKVRSGKLPKKTNKPSYHYGDKKN